MGQKRRQLEQTLLNIDKDLLQLNEEQGKLKAELSLKKCDDRANKQKQAKALKEKIGDYTKEQKQTKDRLAILNFNSRLLKELYYPNLTPEQRTRLQLLEDRKINFETNRQEMYLDRIRKVDAAMIEIDVELRDLKYTPEQRAN